ncbi:dipeptide/oligopeptide/nickel ABC transporter permease/ATP-binding protein [Corynebacterium sp. ES2794-CONJ1]|uniref:dipeptide/oligopeptide/nickel ABC transporter permease/ATP-binding protein n=1 Tax=unclassified Corynebacterium TaxID=2624378 RepID=UPI0021686F94|nr:MULTISPECIES: dipeptide/oligopeptide/nickel ABC transporter permease/ATP-binding protein [unclassified Corynebacterium]MCS4489995.1 dipeptide/oligopeptide/nickel ABC transporter permease/ATP-binding protein [Corynebacterium sp. ES2775-CONJ]MCS4491642.1 dipeptide/oligopeptide/nickel ABC transporter permease/ATP-binding protein [Corynebacterium sp. ES2715-CONJ3]MCS4531747.1 dipeptide/oligopeptide/nickel ABC transporter permease/ATP-binding protein [Corynebacterium sp. ES2730-CONJ]MCU9519143.1 
MRKKMTQKLSTPGLRFKKSSLPVGSQIAVGMLGLVILMAIFAPLITKFDPLTTSLPFDPSVVGDEQANSALVPVVPPDSTFWFGTDASGRDVFARVAYGARYSLAIGLLSTAMALVFAAVLGSIAATAGKVVSEILMRILDIIMSFPGIALVAVFVASLGKTIGVIVFSIGFLYVPQLSRIVRANVLSQFGEDYVSATKVMGARTSWILFKHVARNCIAPIMVFATVLVADAIVLEASLSFIQAGVQPPAPSWGNILADGKQLLTSGFWWPTFFPGLMILITTLSLNVLSEGLTDALAAPRARGNAKFIGATEDEVEKRNEYIVSEYVRQKESLGERLDALRISEISRDDRLILSPEKSAQPPLLEVKNLTIKFPAAHGDVAIVDNVSFSVRPSETMGLVGESGCGKSISSMAVMGLLPDTAEITGSILFDGHELVGMDPKEHNSLRGHEIAMIYQDALSSLNPSMLISSQMKQLTSRGGTRTAEDLLELVGLDPDRTLKSYPHELSGGQRQRVLIAMALTRDPKLVIADEPTTALDVTVQKQVIDLLHDLQQKLGFAMVFVSHDLALVASVSHRVTVMYAGQIVEQAPTAELMTSPTHEYTKGLLGAVLSIESGAERLHQVPGTVPSPREFVTGDRFAPRSSHPTVGIDTRTVPVEVGPEHWYAELPEYLDAHNRPIAKS